MLKYIKKNIPIISLFLHTFMCSAQQYSIKQTAKTLERNQIEIGGDELHYGLNDEIMLSTKVLEMLTIESIGIMGAYRYSLKFFEQEIDITPKLGGEYTSKGLHPKVGLWSSYNFNLGDKNTIISLGVDYSTHNFFYLDNEKEKSIRRNNYFSYNFNLDYHITNEGLLYLGKKDHINYFGYSHCFAKKYYLGLIFFGDKFPMLPLPYLYVRF
jgi:hypothetical protein